MIKKKNNQQRESNLLVVIRGSPNMSVHLLQYVYTDVP